MSDVIEAAVSALSNKLAGEGFDGIAKFVIDDEGSIVVDNDGVRIADDDSDVTMTSDTDTFRAILDGSLNPTAAFMSGRLKIEGDMGAAMRLGSLLA